MADKKRLPPEERRENILAAALDLSRRHGYTTVTREGIAEAAGCAPGLVSRYFGTMQQLRRAVMRAAVHQEVLEIVGQGLTGNDPHALKASEELKRRAMERVINA
jgi:AcrR family transcriptional regulator